MTLLQQIILPIASEECLHRTPDCITQAPNLYNDFSLCSEYFKSLTMAIKATHDLASAFFFSFIFCHLHSTF